MILADRANKLKPPGEEVGVSRGFSAIPPRGIITVRDTDT